MKKGRKFHEFIKKVKGKRWNKNENRRKTSEKRKVEKSTTVNLKKERKGEGKYHWMKTEKKKKCG